MLQGMNVIVRDRDHIEIETRSLFGTFRRFGLYGPVYEIVGPAVDPMDEQPRLRIRVLESGETLDYRISAILEDPVAT